MYRSPKPSRLPGHRGRRVVKNSHNREHDYGPDELPLRLLQHDRLYIVGMRRNARAISGSMADRLKNESSPYLRQHADNPVDWYPWGEEAFAAAKAAGKPIFVSIGYAACHWCHVMAHESFEDEATAAVMNEHFVNIKVDREERPEVDAVYMAAIHVTGEGGGWPLSAFCDSDGRPYFLGTYFPPEERYGRPSFKHVVTMMARIFHEKRDQVADNANALLEGVAEMDRHHRRHALESKGQGLDASVIIAAGRRLAQGSDPRYGGFGHRPKFPSSSAHALLGRAGRLKFGEPARAAFLKQCEGMAAGGIYDHLGGGFARYSVDEKWLVPHFEKMLYDNGQLLEIYGDAFALTGTPAYARAIKETVGWLEREMLDASGGLYSSLDADSEGEEGKFYVWTPAEIKKVLGADALEFNRLYGVTESGNFEHNTTVLSRVMPWDDRREEEIATWRQKLFEARAPRVRPGTDDKILAAWNGLAVSGLSRAYATTGFEPARALARRVAEFLWQKMVEPEDKEIYRVFHDGTPRLPGTIDDFAFVGRGFLDLAEVLEDRVWWDRGQILLREIELRFYRVVDDVPVFFMTDDEDASLLAHRPESNHDGAIPSGAAVAIDSWLRLARVHGDDRLLRVTEEYLSGRVPGAAEQPFGASHLLLALDRYLHGAELVITEGEDRQALLEIARREYAPALTILGPWAQSPLLEGKARGSDGKALAYLCRGQTCSAPTSDPNELARLLAIP
jgi:uncharacterized protein YyaL (SSP411 family)